MNDSLYEWHVRLHHVDPDSPLAKDMAEQNFSHILLNLNFPDNFPFSPPFMRVVEPRIEKGFVMDGGAICMELLTPRGWASAYTVEALLMQFSASLVKGQGRIAKNVKSASKEFSRFVAQDIYVVWALPIARLWAWVASEIEFQRTHGFISFGKYASPSTANKWHANVTLITHQVSLRFVFVVFADELQRPRSRA